MIDLEDLKELSITINFTLFLKINISEINIFKVYKQQQQQKKGTKIKMKLIYHQKFCVKSLKISGDPCFFFFFFILKFFKERKTFNPLSSEKNHKILKEEKKS